MTSSRIAPSRSLAFSSGTIASVTMNSFSFIDVVRQLSVAGLSVSPSTVATCTIDDR